MDLTAPFKPEFLRPITTLIVPGTIAVGPFVLVLGDYVAPVANFWDDHTTAFAVLLAISVLAAGFIIEDVGANIEFYLWDKELNKKNPTHLINWNEYLKLRIDNELVGERYLDAKVTQLKFELSMAPALIIFWSGLLWLQVLHPMWSIIGFILVTLLLFTSAVYLLWESWQTAKVLSKTRALIIEAINAGPKGTAAEHKLEGHLEVKMNA